MSTPSTKRKLLTRAVPDVAAAIAHPNAATTSRRAGPRRTLLTTALALASALAMSVAIAPQAHAQTTNPDPPPAAPSAPEELGPEAGLPNLTGELGCPLNRICLYEHSHFRGRMRIIAADTPNLSGPPHFFNDITSSLINNTPRRWCVYVHKNYGGRSAFARPHRSYPTFNPGWNDVISSLRRC